MIGIITRGEENVVVREFFQLFKTPWCGGEAAVDCEVLLCSGVPPPRSSAKLILIYSAEELPTDIEYGFDRDVVQNSAILRIGEDQLPISGRCLFFRNCPIDLLKDEDGIRSALVLLERDGQTVVRVGFDLFSEIHDLLRRGQPSCFAAIPTVELHIDLVRQLIIRHSIPLVEVPPIPVGFNFIACLTHDVDHARVRNHFFDGTMFGFLFRALVGSIGDWIRGRKSFRALVKNYRAVLCLPFVYLGWARDFWDQFDRYLEIEKDAGSTFFVIPREGEGGQDLHGRKFPRRAARYRVRQIAANLAKLVSAGREIAVHGIDGWRDSSKGEMELHLLESLRNTSENGVRMHWLFFDERSPTLLESAGYTYDSTIGYNDAVGYRAGTAQVFKPLQAERLLELPMNVMDTALFYPSRMNLSPWEAHREVGALLKNACRFGGVLTVSWHDRSIGPERWWDEFYINLLHELRLQCAWLPTAALAVAWFRRRRSIELTEDGAARVTASATKVEVALPAFRLRTYHARAPLGADSTAVSFTDVPFLSYTESPFEHKAEAVATA
jgi:peptidoglycan/xylan/chitin deacetylase (PgdA/CDA1 family)